MGHEGVRFPSAWVQAPSHPIKRDRKEQWILANPQAHIYQPQYNIRLFSAMTTTTHKFHKREGKTLTAIETSVAQNLTELESANNQLKGFTISKVIEIPNSDKKEKPALIVFVPYHHLKALQANSKKLSIELEKRLKTIVLLVVSRTIESKWIKLRRSQKRPNSRTLTAVYDAILDDLVLPGTIIGKNTRVRLDGTSYIKVTLDKGDQHLLEDRVSAIKAAYKLLTTREIEISFAQDPNYHSIPQVK